MVEAAGATDPGISRGSNEDAHYVGRDARLFVVADGLSGCPESGAASRLAVERLQQWVPDTNDPIGSLRSLFVSVSQEIRERSPANESEGTGCTCTALLLLEQHFCVMHVGDSRAYLLRNGRLEQITRDHNVAQRLVELGGLGPDEAACHPLRHRVFQYLGRENVVPQPYVQRRAPGDAWLLCTDGLPEVLGDGELKQWLAYRSAKPERLCDHLIDCARERQARDNVTLVIVRDTPDPSPANSAFDRHLA